MIDPRPCMITDVTATRTRPSEATKTIARAIKTFARGFAFTRSFTHPCEAEQVGAIWVVRDGRRTRLPYRNEEWIAHGVPPKEVDRVARAGTRGRFAVCAIHGVDEPDADLRAGYKALRYRLRTTEPFMVHDLKRIPSFDSPAKTERVLTQPLADRLHKATKSRQILPEHLTDDAPLRQYIATMDDQIVGWVRSIRVDSGAMQTAWCSNMFVQPAFRRRGIARALLSRMLRDDRNHGANQAVLLASHTGALLYPVVGYKQIGTLLLLTPKRK